MALTLIQSNPYGFKEEVDEVIASLLLHGHSMAEVGRQLELGYRTVYTKCNHPEFIRALRVYKDEMLASSAQIKARIEISASRSLDKLIGLLDSDDEDIVKQTAFGLIDRAGHSVKQKSEVTHTLHIDESSAKALTTAFKEVAKLGNGNGHSKPSDGDSAEPEPSGHGAAAGPGPVAAEDQGAG